MGSHPAITGAISNHQSIPPHRMVMVAIDPLIIDRSTTGTIPAASSAPPTIPMALGTHAHAPLAQILLIGNLMTIPAPLSADLTTTLAQANDDPMTIPAPVSARDRERDQTIGVTTIV